MHDPVDTPLEVLGACIFLGLWVVGVVSWFYTVWEFIAALRLRPSAFERGRRVLSLARELPQPAGETLAAGKIMTATGQFRFLGPTECLFTPRFGLWMQTPFPLKGRIRFSGSQAQIECRAPLGPALFLAAWTLAVPIVPVLLYIAGKAPLVFTLGFVAGGVGLPLAMVWSSLLIERRRALRILREIEAYLGEQAT